MNLLLRNLLLTLALPGLWCGATAGEPSLPQETYVWQRAWTPPVPAALRQHGGAFSNVVALAAEVSWKQGRPQVVRVPLDFDLLRSLKTPVGLALRIGAFPGPFAPDDQTAQLLTTLATELVSQATAKQLALSELQLDFDCAEAKLAGYRVWIESLRRRVAPVPLTFTALPAWLKRAEFAPLAKAADGFVLQVHSVARPRSLDAPFTLCDPAAARSAVTLAGAVGAPFRVALPTYGYLLAFAPEGKFIGLSAEGPTKNWPADVQLREVRADAPTLAELVQGWATNRPANLRGVIWYRLPVAGDTLNWRWPTLAAMLALRQPQPLLRAELRRAHSGLVEIVLVNAGELDLCSRPAVTARWRAARLVAGDALRGFELVAAKPGTATFQTKAQPCRLSPGDGRVIGWLRLSENVEVQVDLHEN
jgi:hypothetical protein